MSASTGTLRLLRLAGRRERVRIPVWIAGLSALLAAQAAGNAETYATQAERTSAAVVLAANPALRMLRGPAADTSAGALLASDAFWILAILTALLSAFTVVRHTRHEEETGRGELVGAAPVGSHAGLVAALVLGALTNLLLAGALALTLLTSGLPADGALAFGTALGATGLVFVGVGGVVAQLSPSARAASSMSVVAVGVAYLLRASGDALGELSHDGLTATSAWPSWLSPIGWAQQVKAFAENTWWPLGLSVLAFAVTGAAAAVLLGRRDFGQGMLPPRLGPPTASTGLLGPLGMAWRMQRGPLAGWCAGMIVLAAVLGSVGRQIDDLSSNPEFVDLLARLGATSQTIADTYFAAVTTLTGAIIACYPAQTVLRLASEEADGRLEPVLATAVERIRWLLAHLTITTISILGLLTAAGATTGLVHGLSTGDLPTQVTSLTAAALAQGPAILTLAGLAVAIFATIPRWATATTWATLTAALLLGPLGEALGLPDGLRDISPFTHAPAAPAQDITAGPLLALTALAVALTAAGAVAFHRRDLALRP